MKTEARHPGTRDLDVLPHDEALDAILEGQASAIEAVRAALPRLTEAARGIEERISRGGRLVYAGAGTSGRLAVQDAAELPPTFGFERTVVLLAGGAAAGAAAREGAEDDGAAARNDVDALAVGREDVLIGIAASGATPYTREAVRRARQRGAFTVGIANNPEAPLLEDADVGVLLDTGPEVLTGSTRMAAGTAQKAALNALSTVVLARSGGAYENLMVGMRPVNEKLRVRAARIVREATGADEGEARGALEACGGRIRDAIVVIATGWEPAEARRRLEASGERVRDVLAASGTGETASETGRAPG